MKRVIVVGSSGQDGAILFERLRAAGHYAFGIDHGEARCTHADAGSVDILDPAAVSAAVAALRPDEIYYLAAFHHASEEAVTDDRAEFAQTFDIQVKGVVNFLAALREEAPQARFFYAGSAWVFGMPPCVPQDEDTPHEPDDIYGISKAAGMSCVQFYRQKYGLFACSGILYNHESPRRPPRFVTQKIIRAAVAIKAGEQSQLVLGNLDAIVDWGYAPDYVDAMVRMLALPAPRDFIIATGEPRTVREFTEAVFGLAGLDWRRYVVVSPELISRRPRKLVGNSRRLTEATGWRPAVPFSEWIKILYAAEERRRERD